MSDDIANGAAPVAEAASTPAPATEAPASIRDTMEAVFRATPINGPDGRFQSHDTTDDAAPSEAAPAAPETTDQPETPVPETAPAPAAQSIEAPASWSADVKAKWATLPPDVQSYIAQRESEAHKAITQTGEKLKGYEALDAVIGPRREALRASWGNEGAAIQQLFQLSDFATQNPAGFVQWFAEQNRVDLSRLNATAAAPADPQVAALQQKLNHIETTVTQQQAAAMEADIQAFATAKASDGTPLRPHFADVRQEMGRLISAGIAATLEDAYTKAIRTNDAVWAKVEAERVAAQAKAEQERQAKAREEQAKAAAEAKRAASVNVRAVGAVSGSPARAQTIRETMAAVYRQSANGAA